MMAYLAKVSIVKDYLQIKGVKEVSIELIPNKKPAFQRVFQLSK